MKKWSILLVDDLQDMLEVLWWQLNVFQYNIFQFIFVIDVIDLLQYVWIDLFIIDMCMLGFDGMYLVKYVKLNFFDLLVLVIIGFFFVFGVVEVVKLGVFDYFFKLFMVKEL